MGLAHLVDHRCTTIDDYRPNACLVAELLGLIKDLAAELTGGGQDQGQGIGLPAPATGHKVGQGDVGNDGEAEGCGFA